MTRQEALALGRPLGGHALSAKIPPAECPRCKRSMAGKSWYSWLGHLGLHGLADNHFGGDLQAAHDRLSANGLARQDPFPENGAFRPYIPVSDGNI